MDSESIAGASDLPDFVEEAIYSLCHPRTVSEVPEHLALRAAIRRYGDERERAMIAKAIEVARAAADFGNALMRDGIKQAVKALETFGTGKATP